MGGGGELEREGERRVSGRMGQERQGRKEHDCELLACPSCGDGCVCAHEHTNSQLDYSLHLSVLTKY